MFIPPTAQEARKGEPPIVRVITTSLDDRIHKPETDEDTFAEAAREALAVAHENGYSSVAYDSVSEFMKLFGPSGRLGYEYVWMFTAWDQIEERE
ncbi:hypothetical protein Leucomu_05645 [Leucobacter muris]|uniref:Uncharacterized protein n=1 Tax=Leucobacter muris TaxID=1935379 RepID=A0ABX5QEJ9_9MICO|nr:hypothetical protein [Leucobacter muris]QAB17471.1 hypothetical protein Leucomu_05645 [Leucobacter muris]